MSDRLHTESAETLTTNNGTTAPQVEQVTDSRAETPNRGDAQQPKKCILPPVARLVISRSISALLPLLCLLQLALWSLGVIELFGSYWAAFKAFDIIGIAALLITLGFYIIMTAQSIYGLVALCRREHRTHLATFNTMLCFMTLVAALRVILPEHTAYFAPFAPSFLLDTLGIMMVIYALVRLTEEDLRRRRCAMICSAVALVAVWVLFCQGAGNFAVIVLKSGETLSLEELNLFRFLQAATTDLPLTSATSAEESLVYLIQIGDHPALLLPFLALSVLLADLFPFAALSAVGYFVYGIAGRTDEQYLHLRVASRFNVSLIIAAAMALISAVIQLIVGVVQKDIGYSVVLSLQNIALTLALLLAVAVATTIPYRIYSMHYKRQFAAFQKMKEEA